MDREAMQMALEALELLARYENPSTKIQVRKPKNGGLIVTMYPHKVATEAAAALREMLAQPEQTVSMTEYKRLQDLVTSQGIRLMEYESAQPEQEPFCFHDGRNIVGKEYADHSDVFPLYTSPNPEQQKPVRFNCTVIDDAHLNGVPLSQWGKQHEMQPCAGRNCGSTNPNLHSAECFEDYEKSTGMNQWQGLTDEEIDALSQARSLTDELMDCVDRLGSEADTVDPRVWQHLLVYAPKPEEEPMTQPAQQQEPVGDNRVMTVVYRNVQKEDAQSFTDHPKAVWFGWCHAPYQRDDAIFKLEKAITSPPASKPWVGLTDEEIHDLIYLSQKIDASNSPWFDCLGFYRAVEQALKEKNHG